MAKTRKEKNLEIVLKLCDEQQEEVGRFLEQLLKVKKRKKGGNHETM